MRQEIKGDEVMNQVRLLYKVRLDDYSMISPLLHLSIRSLLHHVAETNKSRSKKAEEIPSMCTEKHDRAKGSGKDSVCASDTCCIRSIGDWVILCGVKRG